MIVCHGRGTADRVLPVMNFPLLMFSLNYSSSDQDIVLNTDAIVHVILLLLPFCGVLV